MRTSLGAAVRLPRALRRPQRAQLQIGSQTVVLRTSDGKQVVEREQRSFEQASAEQAGAAVRASLATHPDLAVQVRLACAWSRLLLLPWMAQLTREERWHNYARARFEQLYGENAQAWDIRLARDLPGRSRVAVAWPVLLREELAAHANVHRVRVGLLEDLEVLLAQEPAFSGCLAELEPGRAGFLLLCRGRLERVRWCRFDQNEGLAAALCAEWAGVVGDEADEPGGDALAFALSPPAPPAGSERARLVTLLASCIGARQAFCLPEWT